MLIGFMLRRVSGTLMAFNTAQYPYLSLLSPAGPVSWHTKSFSLAMAQAKAVRVSPRGLYFISKLRKRNLLPVNQCKSSENT